MTDPQSEIVNGRTPSGRTLVVYEADNPRDRRFVIDGEKATVLRCDLYRDGGTRRYETSLGLVLFPHRLGSDDRTPRLDGERVQEPTRDELTRRVERLTLALREIASYEAGGDWFVEDILRIATEALGEQEPTP